MQHSRSFAQFQDQRFDLVVQFRVLFPFPLDFFTGVDHRAVVPAPETFPDFLQG